MLEELSAAGVSSSEMADVKDEVALVALHCAVLFGNKTERWERCIPILEQCLTLATDPKVVARIRENLDAVRKNHLFHSWLKPISSAPGMGTVNGIGFTLYGCSDMEPTTGSYMTTYYFGFFFIPIFPICRYRVTRNGRSYCFFGKAPLRLIDKWHIGIVLAHILFVLVPAIVVNEPTARPTGTATPSTTTPPKLDFVPDSTTSRGGAPQEVFRIRNEQRRILNAEKEQIEQDRTRLNRLERQSEDLSREIERDRLFLNRESQFQVDSYNAKVDQYNELVQQAKTAIAAFNERVRNYNAQLGQLQR
jgi:hypothetical protein